MSFYSEQAMQISPKGSMRTLRLEVVPRPASSSFAFREFRWPAFPFNWHYHPEFELTFIAGGSGVRFVGDSIQEFRAGDVCLLGPNLPHCWASHAGVQDGVRSLVIQFLATEWGERFWRLPEMHGIAALLQRASRGLRVEGETRDHVVELMVRLTKRHPDSWRRLGMLLEMLGLLSESRDLSPIASLNHEPREGQGRLKQILQFIHEHLAEDLSQHTVAAMAGMSAAAFSQFFKRSLNRTFVSYVNELRVHNACRALIETEEPVTQIAYEAGFNNLSHFHNRFRRFKKITPQAYRQAARKGVAREHPGGSERTGNFR